MKPFSLMTSPLALDLDLQGGLQVLLEADVPAETEIDSAQMEIAREIVQQRTDALGVNENIIQVAGDRRIVGEFPGLEDTEVCAGDHSTDRLAGICRHGRFRSRRDRAF